MGASVDPTVPICEKLLLLLQLLQPANVAKAWRGYHSRNKSEGNTRRVTLSKKKAEN